MQARDRYLSTIRRAPEGSRVAAMEPDRAEEKTMDETKSCERCGEACTSALCTNCWEVEKRLSLYLKSKAGQRFVLSALIVAKDGG